MTIQVEVFTKALEQQFRHVHQTRMADVPIINPKLTVQAIGFKQVEQGLLGVLITPWFINLVLLPIKDNEWIELPVGSSQSHIFSSGAYQFLVGEEENIGRYQSCSLLSPILEIADQDTAIQFATAALKALDDKRLDDADSKIHAAEVERRWHSDEMPSGRLVTEEDLSKPSLKQRLTEQPISRRDLFRGRFLQDND
jgi:[NiFe] hydrogenase assembly HybE family chaperone